MTKINYSQIFTYEVLTELYINQELNPYEIAKKFNCEHKTIRSYLKKHAIKLRTRSEYNSLARKTYSKPSLALLNTPLSLILHSLYKCEGRNSTTGTGLEFCNQDVTLIKQFCLGIQQIYQYESIIKLMIQYNFNDENSKNIVTHYQFLLKDINNSNISCYDRIERKNPIVRVNVGGRRLAELFFKNMNNILELNND